MHLDDDIALLAPQRPSQLLVRALALLTERGFHQGSLVDWGDGRCCTLGACYLAALGGETHDEQGFFLPSDPFGWPKVEYDGALFYLAMAIGGTEATKDPLTVQIWNDRPGRTLAEVTDLLSFAVALAKGYGE